MLMDYGWPGNVRELRNVMERYAVFGRDEKSLLGREEKPAALNRIVEDDLANLPYHEARRLILDRFDAEYLPLILDRSGGVVARAAEHAGVARTSFYRMLERIRLSGRPPG